MSESPARYPSYLSSSKPSRELDAQGSEPQSGAKAPLREKVCLVVGIGASAGGLEALTQMLTHLPPTAAFLYALQTSGCLLLGNSESLGILAEHFVAIDEKHKICRRNLDALTSIFLRVSLFRKVPQLIPP